MATLTEWVHGEVCKLLGPETPRAYSEYIHDIQELNDVKDYLLDLCGGQKTAEVQNLVDTLAARRTMLQGNVTVYKKGDDNLMEQRSVRPKKKKEPKKVVTLDDIAPELTAKTPLDAVAMKNNTTPPKKKTTYVSLYGKDGEARTNAVLLPGRNVCECQAQKHGLINNCLGCGRVVCEQERSGPCLFCGKIVCTPEEKKILARESNKSEKLLKKLQSVGGGGALTEEPNKGLQKAEEYKKRLLEYDRTYVQRTKVIDDESDYYVSDQNVWLSPNERKAMKEREKEIMEMKFGSRLNRKVTLDFAGRKVIDEEYQIPKWDENSESSTEKKPSTNPLIQENFPKLQMPKFINKENQKPPKTDSRGGGNPSTTRPPSSGEKYHIGRLQDKQLQQMSDTGMCLSMHQPWASLLVKGIKKDEGRVWYSNHRGRLWIAAASHKGSVEEIEMIEKQHLQYAKPNVEFPKEYPTSCLLGCVNVDEVLSQEEYRTAHPSGESASPYVFVCSGFEELLVKIPVSGKHKIWKLPTQIHQAAKKGRTILHDEF